MPCRLIGRTPDFESGCVRSSRTEATIYRLYSDQLAAQRRHYRANKSDYLAKNRRQKRKIHCIISAAKDKPCGDCRLRYPLVCMDFDHVRDKKAFNIGGSHQYFSMKKILEEIAKCDVVCSNCHRIRTSKRIQFGDSVIGNTSGSEPEDSTFDS